MRNKKAVIISLILLLVPIIMGIIFYDRLPDMIPTNFDFSGEVRSYDTKAKALFITPLTMIIVQGFLIFMLNKDPRKRFQSEKLYSVSLFIIPVMQILISSITIMYAFNNGINIARILSIFIALMYIIMGNFLPKAKRNYTMGIRTPWTLDNDVVWDKTHRLGGYTFVAGGILLLLTSMFLKTENNVMFFILIFIPAIIPVVYSFIIFNNLSKEKPSE